MYATMAPRTMVAEAPPNPSIRVLPPRLGPLASFSQRLVFSNRRTFAAKTPENIPFSGASSSR
jgi:hypothetical protein